MLMFYSETSEVGFDARETIQVLGNIAFICSFKTVVYFKSNIQTPKCFVASYTDTLTAVTAESWAVAAQHRPCNVFGPHFIVTYPSTTLRHIFFSLHIHSRIKLALPCAPSPTFRVLDLRQFYAGLLKYLRLAVS